MSKQTAVEWLIEEMHKNIVWIPVPMQEKAKEIEREQMWEYIKKNYCIGHNSLEFHRLEFEQYYNKTYKKEDK